MRVLPGRSAGTPAVAGSEEPRWAVPVLVAVAALPAAAAAVSLLGRHWYAASDQALIALRIDDVGGDHTPLVGVSSRFGWHHPGPLLFWYLAPFRLVFGGTGVLVGMALVNLVALGGTVFVAARRGGLRLAALTALAVVLLTNALGLGALVDPWNPTAAFLPFLLFLVLTWSVVCDDLPMLPLAVAAGTWSLQCHFGFVPLVGGLVVVALGWAARAILRRPPGKRSWRWPAAAVGVGLVLWAPALIDQATNDPGNLRLLYDYALDPGETPLGWSDALGVMGVELHPAGAWLTGDDELPTGAARTGSVLPALVTVAALGACVWWAGRAGHPTAARLGAVVLLAAALALVATSRITGLFAPYIFRWWWAVGALATVALVHVALTAAGPVASRVATVVAPGAVVVTVGVVLAGLPAPLPFEDVSRGIGTVVGPTVDALEPDGHYLVMGVDSATWGSSVHGLFLELERRGVDVSTERFLTNEQAYGEHRLLDPGGPVDGIVAILAAADVAGGAVPPPGGRLVARDEPGGGGSQGGYDVYLADAPTP